MDEDDSMAAEAHQQELEAQQAEEEMLARATIVQQELRDSIALFDEYTKAFWDNLRTYEQERYRNGNHG